MEKTILFDFDGTIADTVGPVVDILNELKDKYRYPEVTEEVFKRFADKRNQEALAEIGVPGYKIPFIARSVWKRVGKRIDSIETIDGMEEVLVKLKSVGYSFGIVTTGSKDNVEKFLKNKSLEGFEFVYAGKNLFGKTEILKKLIRKYKLGPSETIYIGDQTSDIEAAKEVGMKAVAVGWGFNSERVLKEQHPDAFANKPEELVKIVEGL